MVPFFCSTWRLTKLIKTWTYPSRRPSSIVPTLSESSNVPWTILCTLFWRRLCKRRFVLPSCFNKKRSICLTIYSMLTGSPNYRRQQWWSCDWHYIAFWSIDLSGASACGHGTKGHYGNVSHGRQSEHQLLQSGLGRDCRRGRSEWQSK